MAKPSKKSRRNKASPPAVELAPRLAPRRTSAERRLRILERLTSGLTVAHIARVEQLTVRRVRQIIAEMLASREIDPPAGFILWRGWIDAYLWASVTLWTDRFCVISGSHWPAYQNSERRGDSAARNHWTRSAGLYFCRHTCSRL